MAEAQIALMQDFLLSEDMSVEELADLIGDSPLRLYRVIEGEEELGRCAELAFMAVVNGLAPIQVE